MSGSGGAGDGRGKDRALTERPPFDPDDYARRSEASLQVAAPATEEVPQPPPLDKRVTLTVPLAQLSARSLSPGALELASRVDGERTLLDLVEASVEEGLEFVAELHEAGALKYGE